MKSFLFYTVLLFLCGACSYHFELEDTENSPKLVVYTFAGNGDTTWIQTSMSVPVNGKGEWSERLPGAEIDFRVNGAPREVKRAEDDPDRTGCRYYVTEKLSPGDRITLAAAAEGALPVSASTEVPGPFLLDELRTVKKTATDGSGQVLQFQIAFRDRPATADYYGVKIEVMEENWYENGSFDDMHYVYVYPLSLGLSEEPLLDSSGTLDDLFYESNESYAGVYVFTDDKIDGSAYTLHLNTQYWANNDEYEEIRWVHYFYRVTLFSFSREYYSYLRNLIDLSGNKLGEIGLSPVRPTYTNIRNGLGVLGGYMMYRTEWMSL